MLCSLQGWDSQDCQVVVLILATTLKWQPAKYMLYVCMCLCLLCPQDTLVDIILLFDYKPCLFAYDTMHIVTAVCVSCHFCIFPVLFVPLLLLYPLPAQPPCDGIGLMRSTWTHQASL